MVEGASSEYCCTLMLKLQNLTARESVGAAADRYRKHFDENLLVSTVSGCWPRLPSRLVYDKN